MENSKVEYYCVGRLKHNNYMSNGKLVTQSTFTELKRKSTLSLTDVIDDADYDIDHLQLPMRVEGLYKIYTKVYQDYNGYNDDCELIIEPYEELS